MTYDKEVHIDHSRGVVFAWLRSDDRNVPPVRVEVSREFAADNWHVQWKDEVKVTAAFESHKMDYLEPAAKAAGGSDLNFRVYKVYNR